MSTSKATFTEARDAFVKALADYQSATRDLSVALSKVVTNDVSLCRSLDGIVNRTGPMLDPRH